MNDRISQMRRATRLTMMHHAFRFGYIPSNIAVVTRTDGVKLAWDAPDERKQALLDSEFSEEQYLADGEWAVTITQEHLDAHAAWEKMSLELPTLSERPEDEQKAWHIEFSRLIGIHGQPMHAIMAD